MSIPARTIRRDIRVFISAVTRELGSVRKLVKKGLDDNDYHAIEQDNFPADYRTLIEKDRELIKNCDAVVHIVGHCYGEEPPQRPPDAPRRSYTQLEYDVALELGKPVYVFLIGDGFLADPHELEAPEHRELQRAHRDRLSSTGKDYNPTTSIEQLDQKIRGLRFKVERLEEELQHVDEKVAATGKHLGRRLVLVAILVVAALGAVGFVILQQQAAQRALREARAKQEIEQRAQQEERANQERERIAAENSRQEAAKVKEIQREIAERLLQRLLADKKITAEEARHRALEELPAVVKLPLAEIESLINRKIAPPAAGVAPSPLDTARAALAKGDLDAVFKEADKEKKQGRELAMLEGTAALAKFRGSPKPEWNTRALAAFQRAMALADSNSATEWEAWTDAAEAAAWVLHDLARYAEAEPLMRDCRRFRESKSGPNSPGVAVVLDSLALLLHDTNRMSEAESLFRRALAINEGSYGPEDPRVVANLINLARLLHSTNRMAEAEPLDRRVLAIDERSLSPENPEIGNDLSTVAIDERSLSPENPAVGSHLSTVATLLQKTNRMAEAEPLFRRALAITERSYGPKHPDVAIGLNNLATLLHITNRMAEAEPLYRRALAITERSYGPDHPDVAIRLGNVARLLQRTNRMAQADPLFRRALAITEKSLGPNHPEAGNRLNSLGELLFDTNRMAEAEPLVRRALAIGERSQGPVHPDVALYLNQMALLLFDTNRMAEAEPLYTRALAIDERSYGPNHPEVANGLNNLAVLLRATNRMAEAEPLYRQALAIEEQSYGPDHPEVAIYLGNLAGLLRATNRMAEAEPLMAHAIRIFSRFQRLTGHEHPRSRTVIRGYRQHPNLRKLADATIEARIKAASEGTDKLLPIVPELERLLGPSQSVAEVLASLDRQNREQGKPAVYFLGPNEPIAPHIDELLRPTVDGLNWLGVDAFRGGANADAVVLFEAALALVGDKPVQLPAKLRTRTNRAAAWRELGLVEQARDELSKLLPELSKLPTGDSSVSGRALYHLALCQWRLGERAAAQMSAEGSLAAYTGAPKEKPVDPAVRQQSEELLVALKNGKAPPPLAAIDATQSFEAARSRYRACEALTKLGLNEPACPLLDQILGPAKPTKEVFDTLDRQYREQGKPSIWFLPLTEPIAPNLNQLLGPTKTVKEVLDTLDRQYREQGKPAVWFLPLDEPISPHLDELLGRVAK
jgi:tetratricopeptide (TPR) repeat protein